MGVPGIHHVEVWLSSIAEARDEWGWLLGGLGFTLESEWAEGQSWAAGGAYLTLTTSPNLSTPMQDRRRPGVNHIAFKAGSGDRVDALMVEAKQRGWRELYADRYPHAGGAEHYAGWLENAAGFKVELVADDT